MQTNLTSTDLCSENTSASPFYWIMQSGQYNNNYVVGEVGVFSSGGVNGSFLPSTLVNISSFLDGRENVLSKCVPAAVSLKSINQPKLYPVGGGANNTNSNQTQENFTNTQTDSPANNTYGLQDPATILISKYTKEKHSANELSAIDYNRWQPLYFEQQTPRYVIEDLAAERGGLNTSNYIKSAWNNQNNVDNFDKEQCMTVLDPQRDCGPECSLITGYPGVNPFTGAVKRAVYKPSGKPIGQANYPFDGISSQQVVAVGATNCGPQNFSGPLFDQGSCPPVKLQVLTNPNNTKQMQKW